MITDFQVREIVKLWEQTGSIKYISLVMGCTKETINKYLEKAGVRPIKKRQIKPTPVYDGNVGNRPYTNSTIFLVCKWHYENVTKKGLELDKSVKKICELLQRSTENVMQALKIGEILYPEFCVKD